MSQKKENNDLRSLREKLKTSLKSCESMRTEVRHVFSKWIYDNTEHTRGYSPATINNIQNGDSTDNTKLRKLILWLPDFIEYLKNKKKHPDFASNPSPIEQESIRDFTTIKRFVEEQIIALLKNNPDQTIKIEALGIQLSSLLELISSDSFQKMCKNLELKLTFMNPASRVAEMRWVIENEGNGNLDFINSKFETLRAKLREWKY